MIFDGVAKLPPEANGAVVVGGSNAAIPAAYISAKAGVRAAIHHDCGIGRDEAGVSGLLWAEQHGMAMAAVATDSARVGDGADMLQRGIISRVNGLAAKCGVENGQTVVQAVELLKSAPWPHAAVEAPVERRTFIHGVLCIDSVSFGKSEDAGLVVATGSHGGVTAAQWRVHLGHASFSSTMPASAPIARVPPAFPFSILTVLPPLRSPRIRRVSVTASRR